MGKLNKDDILKQLENIEVYENRHKGALITTIKYIYADVELHKYGLTSDNKDIVEFVEDMLDRNYFIDTDEKVKSTLGYYGLGIEEGKIFKKEIPEEEKHPF